MLQRFIQELIQMRETIGLDQVDEILLRNGLIVFRKDKLIFPRGDGSHLTIWHNRERNILEFHETEEGADNKHSTLSRYDLSRFDDEDQRRVEAPCWRVVEPDNLEFSKLTISIPREKKDFTRILYKRRGKRRGILDLAVEREMQANFVYVDLHGFWESDANTGMVFREDDMVGLIFWTPSEVLYFDMERYHQLLNDLLESARIV